MVEETFKFGELCGTMKLAILTLIFKKGDRELLPNYRPISLTNYDYKIIALTLANKIKPYVKKLVDINQTSYLENRTISTNARLLIDLIDYAKTENIDGILISLDLKKAFDSLNWFFMYSVLENMNFGKRFIKWVKIFYNHPILKIKNNGFFSREVKIGRGIRQGCPLSALLFILCTEIMAKNIKYNDEINGISINDNEIKIVQQLKVCG